MKCARLLDSFIWYCYYNMTHFKVDESDHIVKNENANINIYGDTIEPEVQIKDQFIV